MGLEISDAIYALPCVEAVAKTCSIKHSSWRRKVLQLPLGYVETVVLTPNKHQTAKQQHHYREHCSQARSLFSTCQNCFSLTKVIVQTIDLRDNYSAFMHYYTQDWFLKEPFCYCRIVAAADFSVKLFVFLG